jgi:LCP family protein required for cell wall assembly
VSKRIEFGGPHPPGDEPLPRRRAAPIPEAERRAARSGTLHDRIALWFGVTLILLGLFTGFVAFTMFRAHTLNPIAGVVTYFVPAPETVFGKNRIYVLLLGLDYDYDRLDQPTSKDARTDKIEAFALDFPMKVVKSVAIPRDLAAVVNGHEDKINVAYHFGGWQNTDKVVGSLLSMPQNERGNAFDRYISLRINASKDLIEAIGGLDVPVAEQMDYDDSWGHLHIHFKPGLVHMNGEQAVSYARFRHDACSDPCRIKRQQQIERLMIEKLKRDKFNDLTHIAALISVIRRNVDTNLTFDEMRSLGWHFRDVNLADVHGSQIPFSGDKNLACCGNVLVADTDGVQKLVADFLGPYRAATPPPTAGELAAVKPSTITVEVLNGSGVPGLGKKLADRLRQEGYVVKQVGNADSFGYETTQILEHASGAPLAGERVRSDIHLSRALIAPIVEASPSGADLTVVVGRDYLTALNAATPAASPAVK